MMHAVLKKVVCSITEKRTKIKKKRKPSWLLKKYSVHLSISKHFIRFSSVIFHPESDHMTMTKHFSAYRTQLFWVQYSKVFGVQEWINGTKLQEKRNILFLKHRPPKLNISALVNHPPSSTLLALIGASAFSFNKYPHKPYIFWKLNSSRFLLIRFKKSNY